MSDLSDQYENDEQDSPRGLRKQLEEVLASQKEAAARAAAAERELAFAKAGLDLANPKMSYFVKGYDGDLEPEKIKAAATEAGFIEAPAPVIPAQELAAHQQVANLTAGTSTETVTGPAWKSAQYAQEIRAARSKDEVFALMDKAGSPRTSILDD